MMMMVCEGHGDHCGEVCVWKKLMMVAMNDDVCCWLRQKADVSTADSVELNAANALPIIKLINFIQCK